MTHFILQVIKGNETKIFYYGATDGQLFSTGVGILEFLRTNDLNVFSNKLDYCRFISRKKVEECYLKAGYTIMSGCLMGTEESLENMLEKYPQLCEYTGYHMLDAIMKAEDTIYLGKSSDRVSSCEFAYRIDLDDKEFVTFARNERVSRYPLSELPSDEDYLADYDKFGEEYNKRDDDGYYFMDFFD